MKERDIYTFFHSLFSDLCGISPSPRQLPEGGLPQVETEDRELSAPYLHRRAADSSPRRKRAV